MSGIVTCDLFNKKSKKKVYLKTLNSSLVIIKKKMCTSAVDMLACFLSSLINSDPEQLFQHLFRTYGCNKFPFLKVE